MSPYKPLSFFDFDLDQDFKWHRLEGPFFERRLPLATNAAKYTVNEVTATINVSVTPKRSYLEQGNQGETTTVNNKIPLVESTEPSKLTES
jgi:hypothetical protein